MNLYICGDSFCVPDPTYGQGWFDYFQQRHPNINITNLAISGASNYHIYLQVKCALEQGCDYLIYHATSSIRDEFRLIPDDESEDSLARYAIPDEDSKAPMVCGSWINLHRHFQSVLSKKQLKIKDEFFTQFVDLPNLIEKNFIFILHTLKLLEDSDTKWSWTQGGFEHKSFSSKEYFNFLPFRSKECHFNLWDYGDTSVLRPLFHVVDEEVNLAVSDSYSKLLNLGGHVEKI